MVSRRFSLQPIQWYCGLDGHAMLWSWLIWLPLVHGPLRLWRGTMNSVDENPLAFTSVFGEVWWSMVVLAIFFDKNWKWTVGWWPVKSCCSSSGKVLDVSEIENLLLHFTEANKKYATLRHCSLMLFSWSEARKIRKLVMWMMWMWWQAGSDSEVPQWLPGN